MVVAQTNADTGEGTLTINADGSFTYVPDAGFTGIDTFIVQVTDTVTPVNLTVNITVGELVWYVNNQTGPNNPPGSDGRSTDAFETLAEAQAASGPNSTIFVFNGITATTPLAGSIALKNGQKLLGEGVGLTIAGFPTLVPAGTRPRIVATGDAVTVVANTANGNRTGVEIRGLNLASTTGNAIEASSANTQDLGVRISENTVAGSGAGWHHRPRGVDGNGHAGRPRQHHHGGRQRAADRAHGTGTVFITAFDDNVVSGDTGGVGHRHHRPERVLRRRARRGAGPSGRRRDGHRRAGQRRGRRRDAAHVGQRRPGLHRPRHRERQRRGLVRRRHRAVHGRGRHANHGGRGAGVLAATGGPAAIAVGSHHRPAARRPEQRQQHDATACRSPTWPARSPRRPAAPSPTPPNADFIVSGGAATVTYNGTITDDAGQLVSIANTTGGAKSFTGAITDGNDGDGNGISLTSNTGATITFSGGLLLSTGANAAFTATGGGTVNVCDENPCNPAATGALVNTMTTTTGTALNVANTTIGANRLEFRSISANGAANGIVLNNTGGSGSLTVKGNGGSCTSAATCTGGAVQNTTADGLALTNTSNVSLTRMFVGTTGNHGINASAVNGLTLASTLVQNPGNGDNEHGLNLVNVAGTVTIDGATFNGASEDLIHLENNNTNVTFNVTNSSQFTYPTSVGAFANSAMLLLPGGSASITASIQNATFTNVRNAAAQIGANLAGSTGTQNFTFSNNTINVTLAGRASGVVVSGQELTTTNITIDNNNFSGAGGNGVISIDTNDSSAVEGTASGNTIANAPGIGIFVAVDEAARSAVTLNGNTITNAGGDGIQTVNFGGVGVSAMDMIVTNNAINGHSLNTAVNFLGGVAFVGFEDNACVVLRGNSVTGTPPGPTQCGGLACVDYHLEEVGGTSTLEESPNTGNTTANAAYVNSINDAGPVTIFGTIDLTNGATCNVTGLR